MTPPKFYPGQIVVFVRINKACHKETVVQSVEAAFYDHLQKEWTYRVGDWMPPFDESSLTPFSDLKFEEGK